MVSTQALADAKDRAARHCPTEAARVDSEAEEEVPEKHEETEARSGESCGVRIDQDACDEGQSSEFRVYSSLHTASNQDSPTCDEGRARQGRPRHG